MGVKITDMTPAATADGTELIPVSKGAAPRSLTVAKVKDYVVDTIEAIEAADAVGEGNGVFVLQGGALKPVDLDVLLQRALDTLWGQAAEADPTGTDVLPLKRSSTEKTVTLEALATYVRTAITATLFNLSTLTDGSGTLASTDYMLVTQGTSARRIQVSNLSTAIYAALAAHVTGKDLIGSTDADDVLYVVRGSTPYKIKLSQIAAFAAASATIGGSGTTGHLAQWGGSSTLAAGPAVVESGTGFAGPGSDVAVPTTAAVRGEMNTIVDDAQDVDDDLVDADTVLVHDQSALSNKQRKSALSRLWTYVAAKITASDVKLNLATDVGEDLADADLILVDVGGSGAARKSALSRVWTYVLGKIGSTALTLAEALTLEEPPVLPTYTVATAPSASPAGQAAYFSDGAEGAPILAFSDGEDWLRSDTGAAVEGAP